MIKFLLFALFLIILFICKPVVEGFPNENQYPVCNDKFSKGETNYAIESNPLEKPEKGFYSSIIKQTKEKNLPKYFKSPQCQGSKEFKNNYFNDNKVIDISNNNWEPPMDPFYKMASVNDDYTILYPKEYSDDFEYQHDKENKKEIVSRIKNFSD